MTHVLTGLEGCLFPDSCPSGIKIIPALYGRWGDSPIQGPVLWSFSSIPGLHKGVQPFFSRWAHQRGIRLLSYLDSWLVIPNHCLFCFNIARCYSSFTKTWESSSNGRSWTWNLHRGSSISECCWTPFERM